jgi:xanthine dehydrogenase molybdopterin-binding subunit B
VLLGLPADKVRVVQTETGGGFGGKEEYPSMIAGHAALLARKVRPAGQADLRPRRDMMRPPSVIRRSFVIVPASRATGG